MRGGRGSGRGGGRGGGRGTRPGGGIRGGTDVIGDTADELGLTYTQMDAFVNLPPPLFPPTELPAIADLSERDGYLINKLREVLYRMEQSPFYLANDNYCNEHHVDKWRSNDRNTINYVSQISGSGKTLIPAELLADKREMLPESSDGTYGKTLKSKPLDSTFQQLEAREKQLPGNRPNNTEKEIEEEQENDEEEWEEDEGDYGVDYYSSGGDDSGGEDAEAVF